MKKVVYSEGRMMMPGDIVEIPESKMSYACKYLDEKQEIKTYKILINVDLL